MLTNVAITFLLPKNMGFLDGSILGQDLTYHVASSLSPFYSSVDLVRLAAGLYVNKVSDFTLASLVYKVSNEADILTYNPPASPDPSTLADVTQPATRQWNNFVYGRQAYVSNRVAYIAVMNAWDATVARGSKTLANFSVNRISMNDQEGAIKKIAKLEEEADKWRIVLNSGGYLGRAGHIRGGFASKGIYGTNDRIPGRLWMTTGMGANRTSISGLGSWGAPVKFASMPIIQMQLGINFGSYMNMLPCSYLGDILASSYLEDQGMYPGEGYVPVTSLPSSTPTPTPTPTLPNNLTQFQTVRLSTGFITVGTPVAVTVNWPFPYSNDNYTVELSLEDPSGGQLILGSFSRISGGLGILVTVSNGYSFLSAGDPNNTALEGTLHCTAKQD